MYPVSCGAPDQPPEPAPVCQNENESVSDDACVAAESCEVNESLTAVVTDKFAYSECTGAGLDGMMNCECRDTAGAAELYAVSAEEACKAVVLWCKSGFPVPDETWEFTCLDDMAFGDATGDGDICLIERRCGRRLEVGEGFALFDQGIQSVSCEGSNCTCDGEHNILASASADSDAGRCAVLDEFCYGDVTASPTGAISVTNAQTEGDETSCSAAVAAEQWVSWDEDTSVGLSGDIWAFCEHRDALTWSCRCASSDSDSDNFELQGPDFTAPHVKGRSIAA